MKKRTFVIGIIVLALAGCATAVYQEGTVPKDQYSTVRVKYGGSGHLTIDSIDGERIRWSSYPNTALTSEERIKIPAGKHAILFTYHIDRDVPGLRYSSVPFTWNAELIEGAAYMVTAKGYMSISPGSPHIGDIEITCRYKDGKTETIYSDKFLLPAR